MPIAMYFINCSCVCASFVGIIRILASSIEKLHYTLIFSNMGYKALFFTHMPRYVCNFKLNKGLGEEPGAQMVVAHKDSIP
jgi:hypothetical protein